MKALVRKELRENVRIAALGLVVHTLMLLSQYRDYVATPTNTSQPLTNPGTLWSTAWFCGIFGAVLGWLQVHNERRPDLWAFLIHRPMTRTGIFLGKVTAGLVLYALVVGLPLLGFIAWALLPGHVAAPFEPAMIRPAAVYVLAGILYYFAGMLSDLRQARWYASRVLGVGVAIVVSLLIPTCPQFWQAPLLILVGAAILATAVWGGFQSDGHYRGQPLWGKAALTTALMMGCVILAFLAAMAASSFLPQSQPAGTSSNYFMTTNGLVLKSTQGADRPTEVVDLEGKPVLDEKTGKPIDAADFNRRVAPALPLEVAQDIRHSDSTWMQRDLSLAFSCGATHDTLWYYWSRYGRLVAYDVATRRCVGSLGPKGFARDLVGRGDRFSNTVSGAGYRTLSTDTALFQLDLEKRAVSALFTTTADDPILAKDEIRSAVSGWQYTMVVTKRLVYLLTPEGKPLWQAPYEPARASSTVFQLFLLMPPGQFALWIAPGGRWDAETRAKHPGHVMWIARDQGVLKSLDLPALPVARYVPRPGERLLSFVMPPALLAALPVGPMWVWGTGIPRELLLFSCAGAVLVCLPIGLWLGRRYHFSIAAQAGWAVFHLLFGVPGLLAFLSVQEWPAREPCPNCHRPRLVDRSQCRRCGAGWSPPEKTGTEVFAPLQAG
jgi:ABC-type transport system involved in multi-copper enzyme maturation permease subunit